jgi:hypothetical protein
MRTWWAACVAQFCRCGIGHHASMGASSFSPECESYVGQLLVVSPSYGWGWSRLDAGAPSLDYAEVLQAEHFAVRVQEFFVGILR